MRDIKIGLVSFIAPYTIPYINIYLDKIKNSGAECDIVFWDRDGNFAQKKNGFVSYIPYSKTSRPSDSKIKRYFQYISVIRFIRKQLKNQNYDKVVFLQTHAAVACEGIILKRYKRRYIIDIRDFTLENLSIFRKIEKKVIMNSYCTVISSHGYEAFLPKHDYVIAHNYTPVDKKIVEEIKAKKVTNNCINISFIGYVRFYEMAKKLIKLFANDERFNISYIGTGALALESFCKENDIRNVTLHDKFQPSETANFYKDCDLINNLYGNHNRYLDYALSNKLYYAAQFEIPILVSEETYSSEIAEKYHLGISWDPDENMAVDKLYRKICNFDRDAMRESAKEFLSLVLDENGVFERKIEDFINA